MIEHFGSVEKEKEDHGSVYMLCAKGTKDERKEKPFMFINCRQKDYDMVLDWLIIEQFYSSFDIL